MPTLFWPPADSAVMFVLIFITSTGLLQSVDTINVCPRSSINIFFTARKWGEAVTSYYMDELHFLSLSTFHQWGSCSVTCRGHRSDPSVWVTSSTHFSPMTDWLLTITLIHHPSLTHLSIPVRLCAREKGPDYWSHLDEAGSRSLQQRRVLTDSLVRRSFVSVRTRSALRCEGQTVNDYGASLQSRILFRM